MICAYCLSEIGSGQAIVHLGDRVAHMHRHQCIDALRDQLAAKDAELAEAKEKLHKSDGMANEINILVQDSRDREQELAEAEARVKELEAEVKLAAIELDKRCNRADRIAALERELAEAKKDSARVREDRGLLIGLLESIYKRMAVNCSPDIHQTLMQVTEDIRAAIAVAHREK